MDAIFDSQVSSSTSAVAAANRIQGIGGGEPLPSSTSTKSTSSGPSIFDAMKITMTNLSNAVSSTDENQGYQGHSENVNASTYQTQESQSYGTYNPSGASTYSPNSNNGMVGIGNPQFKDPRQEKSWFSSNSSTTTSQSSNPADLSQNYYSNRGGNAYGLNTNDSYTKPNALLSNVSNEPVYGRNSTMNTNTSTNTNVGGIGRVGNAASDGNYERGLLNALCDPAGLKAVPQEDKLQSFIDTVNTLSCDVIGNILLDILNSDAWQSRVKALLVIIAIIKASPTHREWWETNAIDDLNTLVASDTKVAVRTQATKTLKALGIQVTSVTPTATTTPKSSGSLIDDTDLLGGPVDVAPIASNNSNDLLQTIIGSAPVQQSSSFSFLSSTTSATPPVSSIPISSTPAVSNVFDFLDQTNASIPASNPISIPISVPIHNSNANVNVNVNVTDMFGDMSLKTTNNIPTTSMPSSAMNDLLSMSAPMPPQPMMQNNGLGYGHPNPNYMVS